MSKKNRKWLVFTILCLAYMPGSYARYQLSVVSAKYSCGFSNLLDSSIIVNER